MDYRFLDKLMHCVVPVPFVGMFEDTLDVIDHFGNSLHSDYFGIVFRAKHFILFGRIRQQLLYLDSKHLQAYNICSLYCFLFALLTTHDEIAAERLFVSFCARSFTNFE